MKRTVGSLVKNQSGQGAFVIVLVMLVLGGLIIGPLLSFMGTGLKVGQMHEAKVQEYYAADAGIEDALWQINNDQLSILFPDPGGYDPYAYSAYSPSSEWEYSLGDINDKGVSVNVENVWIPKDVAAPSPSVAEQIIEDGRLVVAGTATGAVGASGNPIYQIKITYYYEQDEGSAYYDPDGQSLEADAIGIWLPPGFNYVNGSSNLEENALDPYYCVPGVAAYKSGKAVVWDFSFVYLKDLPSYGSTGYPLEKVVTFEFTADEAGDTPMSALSWIMASGVADISISWDADVKVYKLTSTATDSDTGKQAVVESYSGKSELRQMGSAISGEYRAIGNSLMVAKKYPYYVRDTLLSESNATASDIPSSAVVEGAYLYWSAWLESGGGEQILFEDTCSNFNNWNHGSDWSIYYGAFDGHHYSGGGRKLTMKSSLALGGYSGQTVTASWQHWEYGRLESGDCLQYAFYDGSSWSDWYTAFCNDIGSSPVSFSDTVPQAYLTDSFKMRFKIAGFSGWGEWCDIDNIKISVATGTIADTSAVFKINGQQVDFDASGDPRRGALAGDVTASEWSVLENRPGEYSYACYLDVTALVQAFSDEGDTGNHTGNGTYTVGGVNGDPYNEWSYAAWSLIIIYSSPETRGHQLYLYDDFVYVDNNETLDFPISGFLVPDPVAGEDNAARLTCFVGEGDERYTGDKLKFNGIYLSNSKSPWDNVWNSKSPGVSEDGIDIDTFYVTWVSGVLTPGDTSAQIALPTGIDSWNLVYIIIAFRSDVTTGGSISYLIR